MQEKIGNIILDKTFYPGEDYYCDGDVEEELLEVACTKNPESFREIIEERQSWPFLYHLSPIRENIVSWLPIKKTDKILEVGSGCGAITGAFCRMAGEVTCIDLSRKRSMINAYRHKDETNLSIHVGNFKDIEKTLDHDYDYVCLIGVFEYAIGYMGTDNPFEDFLLILKKHLKPDGHLVIAIENRMGLKYLSGCKEDHSGKYFDGIEGYPNGGRARTFTRKRLEQILHNAGISDYHFYYPYPDYKFAHTVFSDERLPQIGELHDNIRNFDRERMILFDEELAFDEMIREDSFPEYSNSYLLVTGTAPSVKYARFSNDRDDRFCIVTSIEENENKKTVWKKPANSHATAHVEAMERYYSLLCKRFAGSELSINRMAMKDEGAEFEFISGQTLEEVMDSYVEHNDSQGFLNEFHKYVSVIRYNEEFPITNYDLIFQNIFVSDGKYTAIDYEWCKETAINPDEIITRAVYCYLLGSSKREVIQPWLEKWEEENGKKLFTKEGFADILEREQQFQKEIQGPRLALCEIRHQIGNPAFSMDYIKSETGSSKPALQIYEDSGEGFSEANSYFIQNMRRCGKELDFSVKLKQDLINIRIDPTNQPCIVIFRSVTVNGVEVLPELMKKRLVRNGHNGKLLKKDAILFANDDPHIAFRIREYLQGADAVMKVSMRLECISADAAIRLC